ncbi:deoxynucleoside kinase [Vibrio cholerae]
MTIIALSGIDGSGKTSLAKSLVSKLNEIGYDSIYSRPDYITCKKFEHSISLETGEPCDFDRLEYRNIYYSAILIDWYVHLMETLSTNKDKIIVCDRYIIDIVAQGRFIKAETQQEHMLKKLPKADVEIYLNASPELCFNRIQNRSHRVRAHESYDNLCELSSIYEDLLSNSKYKAYIRLEADSNIIDLTNNIILDVEEQFDDKELLKKRNNPISNVQERVKRCYECGSSLYE